MCGKCVRAVETPRGDAGDDRPMPGNDSCPRFPLRRAFVVQFTSSSGAKADRYAGRVEHVVSGRGGRFRSRDELLRLMATLLQRDSDEETQ